MNDFSFGGLTPSFDNRNISTAKLGLPEVLPLVYENDKIHEFPIWNQRKIGACVGHALAKAAQWYWYQKTGEIVAFSPRFLYAIAKCKDGWPDEGTFPDLVAKILVQYGCATEATCPNDTTLDHETYVYYRDLANIPAAAYSEALKYKIPGYAFVPIDEYEFKKAIFHVGFLSVLLSVGSEWWLPSWRMADIDPLRPPKKIVSGHEVGFTGYNGSDFKTVLNHWSKEWADSGFNKLSWAEYSPFIVQAIVLMDIPQPILDEAKNTKFIFTKDLHYGDRSEDVKQLQKRLGVIATGYYGDLTRAAVIAFQDKYGIGLTFSQRYIKARSLVGPATREKLNTL